MSNSQPYKLTDNFTQIPNAVFLHYGFYPGFTGTDLRVYAYLLKNYNSAYGYAFPSQMQASKDLGISDRTFRNSVDRLRDMRLIMTRPHPTFGNLIYTFLPPIEDANTFFETFPQAKATYEKKMKTYEKVAPKKAERKRDLDDWL